MFKVHSLTKLHIPSSVLTQVTDSFSPVSKHLKTASGFLRLFHFRLTRQQVVILGACAVVGLLAFGMIEISTQMFQRPMAAEMAREEVVAWGQDIVTSLSPAERSSWEDLLEKDPALALEICSVTLTGGR